MKDVFITGGVAFGGLILSAWTQWLAMKERKESRDKDHSLAMYNKQFEAYSNVVAAIAAFHRGLQQNIGSHSTKAFTPDEMRVLRAASESTRVDFRRQHELWMVFLPEEVNNEIGDFIIEIGQLFANPIQDIFAAKFALSHAFMKVMNSIRVHLGTDALTTHTLDKFYS